MSSITINGDTSGSVILQAPAVSGSTTLTLPSTSGTVITTATTQSGLPANIAGNGPSFSAYRSSSAQSISSGTYVKVQLNTEDYDTANCFDSTTNYRFTPNVAGYYQINGSIVPDSTSAFGTGLYVAIYKNGVSYRTSGIQNVSATTASIVSISALIYLNGSTDYIELYGYSIGGTGMQFTTSYSSTAMSGFLARGA